MLKTFQRKPKQVSAVLNKTKNKIIFFLIGFCLGIFLLVAKGGFVNKVFKYVKRSGHYAVIIKERLCGLNFGNRGEVVENFSKPILAVNEKSFGKNNQLTFELFRGGTFIIDGQSGYAWQKSKSYRDSAFIRSTNPLAKTYKISVVVGDIDYGLEKIEKLSLDPEYPQGPKNENGCYLLSITDEAPIGHHTNIWWHQHRKVVIDVDNNVWGHGMPNPIFMVYFDKSNKLTSFDGADDSWKGEWVKAVTYDPQKFYKIEIEKTKKKFIMRIMDDKGNLLKEGSVDLKDVWNEDEDHLDYFVIGDPHENYYQGSVKIDSITVAGK